LEGWPSKATTVLHPRIQVRDRPVIGEHDGQLQLCVPLVSMVGARYRPGGVRLWLGEHPYAKELASLGLPKRALLSASVDNVEMTFGDAKEIA